MHFLEWECIGFDKTFIGFQTQEEAISARGGVFQTQEEAI